MIPPEQTAAWLQYLDRRNSGIGSAIALVFRGDFVDMGEVGVREKVAKVRPKRADAVQKQMALGGFDE